MAESVALSLNCFESVALSLNFSAKQVHKAVGAKMVPYHKRAHRDAEETPANTPTRKETALR